jgi:hypothetical protein
LSCWPSVRPLFCSSGNLAGQRSHEIAKAYLLEISAAVTATNVERRLLRKPRIIAEYRIHGITNFLSRLAGRQFGQCQHVAIILGRNKIFFLDGFDKSKIGNPKKRKFFLKKQP